MDWLALSTSAAPLIIAGAVGSLGTILLRWLQKASTTEDLDRKMKVLSLNKEMRSQNIGRSELIEIEQDLTTRRHRQNNISDEVTEKLTVDVAAAEIDDPLEPATQLEMNFLAQSRAGQASLVLSRVEGEYRCFLDEEAAQKFDRACAAWHEFAEQQSEVSASCVSSGSMFLLILSSEQEILHVARISQLREEIERLKLL